MIEPDLSSLRAELKPVVARHGGPPIDVYFSEILKHAGKLRLFTGFVTTEDRHLDIVEDGARAAQFTLWLVTLDPAQGRIVYTCGYANLCVSTVENTGGEDRPTKTKFKAYAQPPDHAAMRLHRELGLRHNQTFLVMPEGAVPSALGMRIPELLEEAAAADRNDPSRTAQDRRKKTNKVNRYMRTARRLSGLTQAA